MPVRALAVERIVLCLLTWLLPGWALGEEARPPLPGWWTEALTASAYRFALGPGGELRTEGGECLSAEGKPCAGFAQPVPVQDNGHFVVADIKITPSGEIWTVGDFAWTVDFAPEGPPQVKRVGENEQGHAFLRKQAPDGRLLWVKTWPGRASGLIVSERAITVLGQFRGTVDFDPGAAKDVRRNPLPPVRPGEQAPDEPRPGRFVAHYTPQGEYRGVWILPSWLAASVTVSPTTGALALAGSFTGTEDLDPSSGRHVFRAAGARDAFITFMKPGGAYGSTRTWPSLQLSGLRYAQDQTVWTLANPLAPDGFLAFDYLLFQVDTPPGRVAWMRTDTSPSFGTGLALVEVSPDGGALLAGTAGGSLRASRGKDLRSPSQRQRAAGKTSLLTRCAPGGRPVWTLVLPDDTIIDTVASKGSRICLSLRLHGGPYDLSLSTEPAWVGRPVNEQEWTRVIGCFDERRVPDAPL